ncbi:divalent-cation tolerance protein CutA [Streptomyces sp. NA04227]|uniref:divalent-cation tolerance protein CutA n=1 Tax=Streptomyces sp. NA04227 TaxID=2742136 RepID=UPI0015918150|nr:divalent-cation tolerance protein CutA [Streptomyces sp. NA04227]QKW06354.1 divalent-cation tolerance protein CutA [Streptomyces sp. NA04227]
MTTADEPTPTPVRASADEATGNARPHAPAGPGAWLTVLTTTDAAEKAGLLADGAVEHRLAACAQINGPVTSVYHWDGVLERSAEWQVLFKTSRDRYPALESWLTEAHDYDNPEIIATPVVHGSAAYLDWVTRETRP